MLYNRSSNPKKLGLVLANGVGVVDSDYYNNPSNEGEIGFLFYNTSSDTVIIKKGSKIGQGVFHKYLITDGDNAGGIREGGYGSTGK
jgi:dUTP pyrophosphatase